MFNNNKKYISYSEQDERPSRFLVDLNKLVGNENNAKTKERSNIFLRIFNKIKKIDLGNIENLHGKFKENIAKNITQIKREASQQAVDFSTNKRNPIIAIEALGGRLSSSFLPDFKFNRLLLFPVIRIAAIIFIKFIKYFYQLCWGAGWLAVFIIRFAWLLSIALLKIIFKLIMVTGGVVSAINGQRFNQSAALRNKCRLAIKNVLGQRKKGFEQKTREVEPDAEPGKEPISAAETIKGKNKIFSWKNFNFANMLPKPGRLLLKPALLFVLILITIILPIKIFTHYQDLSGLRSRVLGVSEAAMDELKTASEAAARLDFSGASQGFTMASQNFVTAREEIKEVSGLLAVLGSVIPQKDIKLAAEAELILEAGQLGAELGNSLSMALRDFSLDNAQSIKNIIGNSYHSLEQASQYARDLNLKVGQIEPRYLPEEHQVKFLELSGKTEIISQSLDELVDIIAKARIFLGFDMSKRYLLVFQNNAEMRASGGFIGSFAQIDISRGEIKAIKAPGGGSYDTEAGLYERIATPEPMHLINPLWHFWDANWWPDWPMSARKLAWFYERSDGPTVDGVISLTPTVVEKILKVIGPVDMTEKYNVILTADNFWQVAQTFSEQKLPDHPQYRPNPYATTTKTAAVSSSEDAARWEPKKIIGDLFNKLIDELPQRLDKNLIIKLIDVFEQSLNEKHILFYFNNEELQAKTEELGWDGKIRETVWDYLMVVNTNIGGGKSDRMIAEEISHTAEIMEDGSIINTVIIKRTHTGIKRELFTGVRNVDWMRIYVPLGSELIEADGFARIESRYFSSPEAHWQTDPDIARFEGQAITDIKSNTKIYDEMSKTVFANWCMVDPGETAIIYVKYKLPFNLNQKAETKNWLDKINELLNPSQKTLMPYALLAQKQPGSPGSAISSTLKLPFGHKIVWKYPDDLSAVEHNGWQINDRLETDKYWAVLVERN